MLPAALVAAALLGAAAPPPSPPARTADPCDRRADVEALRVADDDTRPTLRARLDAEVAAATSARARGCAAAVAAQAALLAGDEARALALLDVVAQDLPSLADDVRPRRALLLAEIGRVDDATRELAALSPRDLVARARVELALADAKKDLAAAKAILRRLGAREASALGRLCVEHGDDDACVDVLLRHPRSDVARTLEQLFDQGAERAVLRVDQWPAARMAQRVRALTGAARPRRAVREGRAWLSAHGGDIADDAGFAVTAAVGEALLRLGDAAAARDVTARSLAPTGAADGASAVDVDGARVHAKALSRLGRIDDAVRAWQELSRAGAADAARRPDIRGEGAFFAAFALIEVDRVEEALRLLTSAEEATAGTPWETQRRWYRAFLSLQRGDAERALADFDVLLAGGDRELRKFRYWRARALDALQRRREAHDVRRALIAEDPLDWYGLLARRDLGLAPLRGSAVADDAVIAVARAQAVDADADAIRLAFALGFDAEARARCRARASRGGDQKPALADVGLCQEVDDAAFGWRRGALFSPVPSKGRLQGAAWRVSYAAPWSDAVDDVAARAAIPRSFVYAIMRTESGFDPTAVSIAGARGALQLLPSVARGIAVHDQLDPRRADQLDDPRVAIDLGGRLLGLLVKEHGSLLAAAAAYNGAPENAAAWRARFGALPVDVFVERIPYKESRDYVKRVLAAEAVYRGLDGGEVALSLPTSLLTTGPVTKFPYDE